MTGFAVDTSLLWQVIWVSLLAGVGISALFSLVILGAARAGDARRAGRGGIAASTRCSPWWRSPCSPPGWCSGSRR